MGHEITDKKSRDEGLPIPMWWAMACRQIGLQTDIKQGSDGITVILPDMPSDVFERVRERASLLSSRHDAGLPTEELPSGGFPDSDDEVADPVAMKVGADGDRVLLDFGRPIRAVSINPTVARYVATMLTSASLEADSSVNNVDMYTQTQVAVVKDVDGVLREAVLRLPSPFDSDNEEK